MNIENKPKFKFSLTAIIISLLVLVLVIFFIVVGVLFKRDYDLKNKIENLKDENGDEMESVSLPTGKIILQAKNKEVSMGDKFFVEVLVDSAELNLVLASVLVSFSDNLSFSSVDQVASTDDSVFSKAIINQYGRDGIIEVASGEAGDANYQDGDDGFTGGQGLLARLEFTAIKDGPAEVFFTEKCIATKEDDDLLDNENKICSKSVLLLDDGKGTELPVELGNLQLTIYN